MWNNERLELLKDGYIITDKYDPDRKRSVFVFKNEEGLEDKLK